jgi:uncharacterized protein YndB with AHSA1/START domain
MNDKSMMVEREVHIRAKRGTVFRYFTDSSRFAAWWGEGSSIDPRPRGKVQIRYPNGVTAGGEVVEMVEGSRIVFTYGYDDPEKPIARGGSTVTITLQDAPGGAHTGTGTLLRLEHRVDSAAVRDAHVPGWRFQLSVFANVVAADEAGAVAELVDRWFACISGACADALDVIVTDDVELRDRFACITGKEDLRAHLAASRMHTPDVQLERDGEPRFCQGTALVDWVARKTKGNESVASGTNVFEIEGGRVASVIGFGAEAKPPTRS